MILTQKSDIFGAAASTLCLIHCLITPFIFVAQTCSRTCCSDAPIWWRLIDVVFLVVSFFAVYYSVAQTTKSWLKFALWGSWAGLCLLIINENLHLLEIAHEVNYIPALGLIVFHFYNRKYCTCTDTGCCAA